MKILAQILGIAIIVHCPLLLADEDNGMAAYKDGNFEAAFPLIQNAAAKAPENPVIQAALLTSLIYTDRVDDAIAADKRDAAAFPASADVLAARGEFAFYMGDMSAAETLLKSAAKISEKTAKAYFGLSKLFRAASFYRTGRLFCLRAHDVDPDDALITQLWLRYVPLEKRRELARPFIDSHPWLYKHPEEREEALGLVESAIRESNIYETEGGPQETTLKFSLLMRDPQHAQGVGLDFRIGSGKPLRMLFDTGASGILVKQSAVDKAGLEHLGSQIAWGAGDKGPRTMFSAVSATCQVGTLKFKTCVFNALEGKRAALGDVDGLIGADFFQDYLVEIDFQKRLLHLKPLPPRPPNQQGYDRVVAPEEAQFTPVFRFAHLLFVSTKVNGKAKGLFLLDTGAEMLNIDTTFAKLTTKLSGDERMHVSGLSGAVKNVYDAQKADLQFGRFQEHTGGLIAFDLNHSPEHVETRMSGVLGIPVLSLFRLTIDYRNGLVNFDYVLDSKKK